jgi:hypothetical protein
VITRRIAIGRFLHRQGSEETLSPSDEFVNTT